MHGSLRLAVVGVVMLMLVADVEGARRKKNIKKRKEEQWKKTQERLMQQAEGGNSVDSLSASKTAFKIRETEARKNDERKRPFDTPNDLYCMGCKAAVRGLEIVQTKALKHDKALTQAGIMAEAMEEVCELKHMEGFEEPPVKVRIGCLSFLAEHEEDLENVFVDKKVKPNSNARYFCETLSRGCLEIPKKQPKQDPTLKPTDYDIKEYPGEKNPMRDINPEELIANAARKAGFKDEEL